jgi:hypothetical protein
MPAIAAPKIMAASSLGPAFLAPGPGPGLKGHRKRFASTIIITYQQHQIKPHAHAPY